MKNIAKNYVGPQGTAIDVVLVDPDSGEGVVVKVLRTEKRACFAPEATAANVSLIRRMVHAEVVAAGDPANARNARKEALAKRKAEKETKGAANAIGSAGLPKKRKKA